jgi:hypothetical protein
MTTLFLGCPLWVWAVSVGVVFGYLVGLRDGRKERIKFKLRSPYDDR